MAVKVTVKMNHMRVNKITRGAMSALIKTGHELQNRVVNEQVIPFDTGHLQNEATYVDDSRAASGVVSIRHDTPYARRLYFHPEYDFQQGKNSKARAEWWDAWLNGRKKNEAKTIYVAMCKREMGV